MAGRFPALGVGTPEEPKSRRAALLGHIGMPPHARKWAGKEVSGLRDAKECGDRSLLLVRVTRRAGTAGLIRLAAASSGNGFGAKAPSRNANYSRNTSTDCTSCCAWSRRLSAAAALSSTSAAF